jgi:hypothetical protein
MSQTIRKSMRKSMKRKSMKRKSMKRKSMKRKSMKRKSMKRKSMKSKSMKRGVNKNYYGGTFMANHCPDTYPYCVPKKNGNYCRINQDSNTWFGKGDMEGGPHECYNDEQMDGVAARYGTTWRGKNLQQFQDSLP